MFLLKRREQASQPDLYGAEVGYFINFYLRVYFAALFKNCPYLICSYSVYPAAEGNKLYEIKAA